MADKQFKTYYLLGLIQNWSWTLFWFVTPFFALLTFLYDIVLTNNWSWWWAVTFTAGTTLQVGLVAIARKTFLPALLKKPGAGIYAVIFAALITGTRNLLIAYLTVQLGLANNIDYVSRFLGGLFLGLGLLLFFVAIMGSRVQHGLVMNKLKQQQLSLMHQKMQSSNALQFENQKLLEQTQRALLPRIDEVKKLLGNAHARLDTVNELRALVADHVRPLSADLSRKSQQLSLQSPTQPTENVCVGLLSDKVPVARTIKPISIVLLSSLAFYAVEEIFGQPNLQQIALAGAAELAILYFIKFVIPKNKIFKRAAAVTLLLLTAFAASLPDAYYVSAHIRDLNSALLHSMILISPLLIIFAVANSIVLDLARAEAENQLTKETTSLARETALFEQQMWLAKRSWSFVIHGTVQAALTAAITRLSSAEELEPYQINMVLQDLDRARDALSKTPIVEVDLVAALTAVAQTWDGLCKVTWQITPRASRALDRDPNARMCVNEIVKETVSNAVRHGEAKSVQIEVDRNIDELLIIKVRNNGRAVPVEIEHGVGTRMLDDLTLSWKLTNNRARGTVDFDAQLPIVAITGVTL